MPEKATRIMSKHTVCMDGMQGHVRDIRKQCSGVSRSSHGCVHADDLRERSVAIEPGGVPFTFFPHGDVGEAGSLGQTNDSEAPKLSPGEDEVLEDSSQGPTQEETDEVQIELEIKQAVEEQIPLRRSQRIRWHPQYLDQYEY